MHIMNIAQKAVLWINSAICLVSAIFPPCQRVREHGDEVIRTWAGFHFVAFAQNAQRHLHINWPILLPALVFVCAVAAAFYVLFSEENPADRGSAVAL